jgi:DNA-binding MarR family transcriptional regulator
VSTETLSIEFCLHLSRAWATLSRRLDGALGSHHGISFVDFHLLLQLQRAPGGRSRPVDLAFNVKLTASGVARSLRSLERIGLVTRQSDPRDARVAYALITSAGNDLVAHATVVLDEVLVDYVWPREIEVWGTKPIV